MTIAIPATAAPQTTSEQLLGQDYIPIGYVPAIVWGEPYPPPSRVSGDRFARSVPVQPAEDQTIAVTYDHGCEVYVAGQAQPAVAGDEAPRMSEARPAPAAQEFVYLSGRARWPAIYARGSDGRGGAQS